MNDAQQVARGVRNGILQGAVPVVAVGLFGLIAYDQWFRPVAVPVASPVPVTLDMSGMADVLASAALGPRDNSLSLSTEDARQLMTGFAGELEASILSAMNRADSTRRIRDWEEQRNERLARAEGERQFHAEAAAEAERDRAAREQKYGPYTEAGKKIAADALSAKEAATPEQTRKP